MIVWSLLRRISFLSVTVAFNVGAIHLQSLDWSERGVFVFGPLVLDFKESGGTEVIASALRWQLKNCSTKDYYCADGKLSDLVLPKHCNIPMKVGTIWEIGGVSTRILNVSENSPVTTIPGRPTYLLGTRGISDLVWVYRADSGVNGVYYRAKGSSDLADIAKTRGLEGLQSGVANRDYNFFLLSTFDAFGPCTDK